MTLMVRKMTKRVDDEKPNRLMEWFGRALMAADFDLRLQDKEKGNSWKEAPPLFLFNKMMRHVNLMMDSGFEKVVIDTKDGPLPGIKEKTTVNLKTGHVHAIKVVNYALMIATRLAGAEVGDKVAEEAGWKGQNITIVSAYSGVTRMKPNENIIEKEPLEAEPEDAKKNG